MPKRSRLLSALTLALLLTPLAAFAQTAAPAGELSGKAWVHTADSLAELVRQAQVFIPARALGGEADFEGRFQDIPAARPGAQKLPVLIFLHGSSGLGLPAIKDYQRWLGSQGIASVAPNSFALPERVSYKSPIDKPSYERIHALRASEIEPTLKAVLAQPWADAAQLLLAGTSEGGVPVARYAGSAFAARLIYAWSCEANYFVESPGNSFGDGRPVLNIISASDPFFSRSNAWLGNPDAQGNCGAALKGQPAAAVLLLPGAPHTLLNLPAARHATAGFLAAVLKR